MTEQQHGATTCNVCRGLGKHAYWSAPRDAYHEEACPACEGTGSVDTQSEQQTPAEAVFVLLQGTLNIMERIFVLLQDCMLDEATELLNQGITDTRTALLAPVTTEAL